MEQTDNKSKGFRIKRLGRACLEAIKGHSIGHSQTTSVVQQDLLRKNQDDPAAEAQQSNPGAQTLTGIPSQKTGAVDELDKVLRKECGDSTLCADCRTIFAHDSLSSALAQKDGCLQIERHWRTLEESNNNGCRFCMFLFATSHMEHAAPEIGDQDTVAFEFRNIQGWDHMDWQVTATSDKFSNQTSFLQVSVHKGRFSLLIVDTQRLTRADDPAEKWIPYRSANTKVNDPRIYAQVRTWLDDCHSKHDLCNNNQLGSDKANILPTYLLHLDSLDTSVVHLVPKTQLPKKVKGYAALSYCWGTTQKHATTRANLDSHLKGILVRDLPRTIQDAVYVTRILELGYLWVDSLCIIQDATKEMQVELGLMAAIYHNAHVVISAAAATTCESGFLEDRAQPPYYINLPFGDKGSVNVIAKRQNDRMSSGLEIGPLEVRAWAYQESFVARRLLSFNQHEVIWSCHTKGGDGGGRLRRNYDAVIYFNDSCRTIETPELKTWCFVVETFSSKKITYEKDRLPALSSVAELFACGRDVDYLAGVFVGSASSAAAQLMTWATVPWNAENKRPTNWRAPSWSPLSVEGKIGFNGLDGSVRGLPTREYSTLGWEGLNWGTTALSNNAPFGEIVDGYIRMRARLLDVSIVKNLDDTKRIYEAHHSPSNHQDRADSIEKGWRITLDAIDVDLTTGVASISSCYGTLPLTQHLSCLLMWYTEESLDRIAHYEPGYRYIDLIWGLAVAKLEDGRYHRVGYVTGRGREGESLAERMKEVPFVEFTFI
jgi:hypothetical protein